MDTTAGGGGLAVPVTREASTAAAMSSAARAPNRTMTGLQLRIMVTNSFGRAARAAVLAVCAGVPGSSSPRWGIFSLPPSTPGGTGCH